MLAVWQLARVLVSDHSLHDSTNTRPVPFQTENYWRKYKNKKMQRLFCIYWQLTLKFADEDAGNFRQPAGCQYVFPGPTALVWISRRN